MPFRAKTHRPLGSLTETERKRNVDLFRGSRHERGYDSKWDRERKRKLFKDPLCAKHLEEGRVVQATVVDHIIPHRGDMDLFWSRSNWQSLCKSCHDAKTAKEDGGFGNRATRVAS